MSNTVRFVQIVTGTSDKYHTLYGLTEGGRVYRYNETLKVWYPQSNEAPTTDTEAVSKVSEGK